MKMLHRFQEYAKPAPIQARVPPFAAGFLGGLLIGGIAGAGTMLLMAPRSGKRTRARLQHQYDALRDEVTEKFEDVEEDAVEQARHVANNVRGKMRELRHAG